MARTYGRAFRGDLSTDFCGEPAATARLSVSMNKRAADSIGETCDRYGQTTDAPVLFHLAGSRERGSHGISQNKLATARNILRYFATCLFLIGS